MLKEGNYRVWVEPEILEYVGLTAEDVDVDNLDDVLIFVKGGKIDGVYCSSGKIADVYGLHIDELEQLIEEHGLVWERATDTERNEDDEEDF